MKPQIDPNNFAACPQYNDWLDQRFADEYGVLNIFGFQPRPSFVLFEMSPDTYTASFADFVEEREENLKQSVFDEFPSPIAHYFYRFENGYENELQRLHLLRDVWEAIIDILHAITIAECRFRRIKLFDPIAFSDLMTESVAQRLLNTERAISQAADQGQPLSISDLAPTGALQTMRELNQSRNAFAHSAAQSETQARDWIGECYADVVDLLDELRGLADAQILRYIGQANGRTMRCELFVGHGFTRTIRSIELTVEQVQKSLAYLQQGQVLFCHRGTVFGLRPFIYFREDPSGHTTKLCAFRRTHGDAPNRVLEFEVVGEAVRWEQGGASFQGEIDDLRSLFGLAPE